MLHAWYFAAGSSGAATLAAVEAQFPGGKGHMGDAGDKGGAGGSGGGGGGTPASGHGGRTPGTAGGAAAGGGGGGGGAGGGAPNSAEATAAALSSAAAAKLLGPKGSATGLGAASLRLPGTVMEVLTRPHARDYSTWTFPFFFYLLTSFLTHSLTHSHLLHLVVCFHSLHLVVCLLLLGLLVQVLDRTLKLVHDYAGWGADAVALARIMLGSLVGKMAATARGWRHDLERPEWGALAEVASVRSWRARSVPARAPRD